MVSVFIDAEIRQVEAAARIGARVCEIHTGPYAHAFHAAGRDAESAAVLAEIDKVRAAGGAIGRLEDWGHPQHHSQEKVAMAGKDTWIDAILPRLDRARYVNELTGQPRTEAELREFLGHAWDTIATNGLSKITPGKGRGFGARANRHGASRSVRTRSPRIVQHKHPPIISTTMSSVDRAIR